MTKNDWNPYCLQWFLSVKINDSIGLVGVWAKPLCIEEYYVYQSIHIYKYTGHTVLIGDFNGNASYTEYNNKQRNHTAVVGELASRGLISAYHYFYKEKQGHETQSTYYHHRNPKKPFHIDHCFAHESLIANY